MELDGDGGSGLRPDVRLAAALEDLVVGAVGLTTAVLDALAPAADLTLQQWRVLVVIARSDGLRIGEIGGRVGLAGPSTSRLIHRLERRGLVQTRPDETDRRATIARTTPQGDALWSTLVEHRRALIEELLRGLHVPIRHSLVREVEALGALFSRYG